jgi:ERCC4-type nuclease
MVLLVDTREQQNGHITEYFASNGVQYRPLALDCGDYSAMLPACPGAGIPRDIYFTGQIVIERKGSLEELAGNLSQGRERFENEFMRAAGRRVFLLIEAPSIVDVLLHNYQTSLSERAFMASLLSWQQRYDLHVTFIEKRFAGLFIYHALYYYIREQLRR